MLEHQGIENLQEEQTKVTLIGTTTEASQDDDMDHMHLVHSPTSNDAANRREGYGNNKKYSNYRREGRRQGESRDNDNSYGGKRDNPAPPPSQPTKLPTEPPFTAYIGNLSYKLTETDLQEFFSASKVNSIRIIKDRDDKPKGFGYVEFDDLPSLMAALELHGECIGNRAIRVSIAEPPKVYVKREDRTTSDWRRGDNLGANPSEPLASPTSSSSSLRSGSRGTRSRASASGNGGGAGSNGGNRQRSFKQEEESKKTDGATWRRQEP